MLTLYELCGKDDERFSPFCWRTRFALAHKELAATRVPVRFTEKDVIAFSGQTRVPVLVDGDKVISDSWKIACHLEEAYPGRPSLFGDDKAHSLTRFIDLWGTQSLFPPMVRLVLFDVLDHLNVEDAAYIRETREKQLGIKWQMLREQRDEHHPLFRQQLAPLRLLLRQQPFLSGLAPAYADYSVFGLFQWARMISDYRLLEVDDPLQEWHRVMADTADKIASTMGTST